MTLLELTQTVTNPSDTRSLWKGSEPGMSHSSHHDSMTHSKVALQQLSAS